MKRSIFISLLIMAVAAGLVWKIDRQLAAARTDGKRLAAEVKRLGVSGGNAQPNRSAKRDRSDRDAEARQLANEYNAEAKKWESVAIMDNATEARYVEMHRRIEALDSARLKAFVTDVLKDRDVHEIMRAERAVKLLPLLAKKDPQGALSLFKEHYAAIGISPGAGNVIPECLSAWASNDPFAAVEWIKKNAEEFPSAKLSQFRGSVIHCAAQKDPRVAFSIIALLGLNASDAHSAMHDIVTSAKSDERMTTTLAALREYREANQADKALRDAADQNLGYFSQHFRKVGFEAASKWINDAKLSPEELDSFCERLSNGIVEDTGKWIEWMGNTLPPGKREWPIMDMMDSWTRQDYEAAGKWLASAPEGPARNAAIRGYAKTIFKHDPETAMQWIMTLPSGKDRDATLKHIHINWPKDDPAGKEAFAKEHGIK
jgi:hypothetical protein